jgi:WD domain, G-beta repeat
MSDDPGKTPSTPDGKAPDGTAPEEAGASRSGRFRFEARERDIFYASSASVAFVAAIAAIVGLYVRNTETILPFSVAAGIALVFAIVIVNRGLRIKVHLPLLFLVSGLILAAIIGAVAVEVIDHYLKVGQQPLAKASESPSSKLANPSHIVADLPDPQSEGVRGVAFSFDYKYLAAADGNGKTYLWAIPADKIQLTLTAPDSLGANAEAFPPNDTMNATGDGNGHIYLWAGGPGQYQLLTDPASKGVESIAITPNSKYLAAGDLNGHTYIWDLATHKIVADLPDPHSEGVHSVAFTPDGGLLAAGDNNGNTYIWEVSNTGA